MVVARVTKAKHADLTGKGAELYGGRWNTKGRPVLYTSSCGALAALEFLAHVEEDEIPDPMVLLRIEVPDAYFTNEHMDQARIPADPSHFKKLGDEWLTESKKPLLRLPSLLVPDQWNLLINLQHALASLIKIRDTTRFAFDPRLLSSGF